MSATLQGIDMLGIKGQVTAEQLNAIRGGLLNAVGLDNFKATTVGTATPASQIRQTCDRARLWAPSGNTPALAKEVDCTIDLRINGAGGLDTGSVAADTWLYRWLIGKCVAGDGRATDIKGLASLSATAPVMPAGYTHKRLVGPSRTGTGGALMGFCQLDAIWLYTQRQLVVHITSTVARTTQSLAAFMPPEAKIALIKFRSLAAGVSSAADANLWTKGAEEKLAGFDADWAEESQATPWIPAPARGFDYQWILQAGSASLDVWCLGFRWPINREP